ncbi:MAG: alpha/beta hydrolase [Ottowia sp.]|nr:alpha/beta hydrolase [Ottowia sp.]
MNAQTESLTLAGPAGPIEALLDLPVADGVAPRGTAVIAHPHPQFGGTMSNKVVQTLARACVQCGWRAVRFNFRGVGASAGHYDDGQGEQDDLLAVVAQQAAPADAPLLLAGFSFGAFVASHAIARLHAQRPLAGAVLVGTAASRFAVAPLPPPLHPRTLVVHGEHDETVPLASVMDWARPQLLPVTVVPGGGHFFHGQLPLLKSLVERHLRAL